MTGAAARRGRIARVRTLALIGDLPGAQLFGVGAGCHPCPTMVTASYDPKGGLRERDPLDGARSSGGLSP
jgi:hypothetical protein